MTDEIYDLTLRAEQHEVPAIVRLRALLKRALRDYGLRCIRVKDAGDRHGILENHLAVKKSKEA